MAERNNPLLKGIIPRFPDYDPYADLYFPGGVPNRWMAQTWGTAVKQMDLNQVKDRTGKLLPGVAPVESDGSEQLLSAAVNERKNMPSVYEGLSQVTYRDDRPDSWHGASMDDWGIYSVKDEVQKSGTPIQTWGSWFDSGIANGIIHRFTTQSNPQRAFIGSWTHGGVRNASPYAKAPNPGYPAQLNQDLCFLDELVKSTGPASLNPVKKLYYYTLGEERWKSTTTWPLANTIQRKWYIRTGNRLLAKPSAVNEAADNYKVDFTATTGNNNRWHTNGGEPIVDYGDRKSADQKMIVYTTAPLAHDTEITGQPVADLFIATNCTDAAFFLYLEDVAPDGRVSYVTEGELRGIDRKLSSANQLYHVFGPYHSFRRADSEPLAPGEVTELKFSLMPISILFKAGHCMRLALAGADADTFARVPSKGDVVFKVHLDAHYPSHIVLPEIAGNDSQ